MHLSDVIKDEHLNARKLQRRYLSADPYPHIVLKDFFKEDLLREVAG